MPLYQLKYARTVILTRLIEAQNEGEAEFIAMCLETDHNLGIEQVIPKEDSELEDIFDEENIWEISEVYE
jgi:hypothetical protein